MSKVYQSGAIVAIFLLLIASAFSGSGQTAIGIHEECEDAMDNDLDGDIDFADSECFFYPFEDGNAENPTPIDQRYTGSLYVSLFDWHLEQTPPGLESGTICFGLDSDAYNDDDESKAMNWVNENNVDCSQGQL